MPYTYNPHRHVKIWVSPDRNVFMNIENQLRFVRMRAVNPNDEITLVYDSSLLSLTALRELQDFCAKYTITSVDVQKDIIPACQIEEELNLLTLYHEEIQHLDQGGNLGAASDILRWLEGIYRLGTYTDFDVEVDTRNMPATLSVNTPMLFNIGSASSLDLETITLNNDMMAVVDPIAANEIIKKVQQSIYQACIKQENGKSPYKNFLDQEIISYLNQDGMELISLCQDISTQLLAGLHTKNQNRSVREFRQHILEFTASNDALLKEEGYEDKKHDYAEILRSMDSTLPKDDDELITISRKKTRLCLLKNSVIHTTGPGIIILSVFPQIFYNTKDVDALLAPYAFQSYGLDKVFQSKNATLMHASEQKTLELFSNKKPGDCNDLSWLPEGVDAQKERENKMNKSALTIQSFFRSYQVRKEISDNMNSLELNASPKDTLGLKCTPR